MPSVKQLPFCLNFNMLTHWALVAPQTNCMTVLFMAPCMESQAISVTFILDQILTHYNNHLHQLLYLYGYDMEAQ